MTIKQSKAQIGNTSALKTGNAEGTKFRSWLQNNGIDFKELSPKMEKYKDLFDWNKDSIAYMKAKSDVLLSMTELYQTVGGKVADLQTEILKLSYFIDMLEKKLLEEGIIPIESKEYMKAIEAKGKFVTELNKLKLDYVTRVDDRNINKSKNGSEDELW